MAGRRWAVPVSADPEPGLLPGIEGWMCVTCPAIWVEPHKGEGRTLPRRQPSLVVLEGLGSGQGDPRLVSTPASQGPRSVLQSYLSENVREGIQWDLFGPHFWPLFIH